MRGVDRESAGELAGQVAESLRNAALGLAGAGASFADVLCLIFYVTQGSPDETDDFMRVWRPPLRIWGSGFRWLLPRLSVSNVFSTMTCSSKSRPSYFSTDSGRYRMPIEHGTPKLADAAAQPD